MSGPREWEGGFSRKTVGWLAGLGIASFVLALLLTAFGDGGRPTPGTNSFSRSALGHRGASEFLQSLGLGAVSRRSPGTGAPGPGRPLIAAEPDPDPAVLAATGDRMAELRREARIRNAALVIVLPKWKGRPDPSNPAWIRSAALMPKAEVAAVGDQQIKLERGETSEAVPISCSVNWPSGRGAPFRVELRSAQLIEPLSGLTAEVTCGDYLLVASYTSADGAEVILVSDPDLLNNQGLALGENAALFHELLTVRLEARGAVFDETIHGFRRNPSLLAEAFRFPLLPASLQTAVFVGVLLWAGMGRFGKPLPPPTAPVEGQEALIESTARLLTADQILALRQEMQDGHRTHP